MFKHFKALVATLAFEACFILWVIIWGIGTFPLALISPQSLRIKLVRIWGLGVLKLLKWLCRIDFKLKGEHLLPKKQCIIASKHQSTWETIFFLSYFPHAIFIYKKELLKLPIFGWYLGLLDMISIDRSKAVAMIRQITSKFSLIRGSNKTLIIFPEGTRVKPGQKVKYRSGIAAIHQKYPEIPVIPVALNSGLMWPKFKWLKQPGTIIVEFLPPVTSMGKREFMGELEDRIESKTNKLLEAHST